MTAMSIFLLRNPRGSSVDFAEATLPGSAHVVSDHDVTLKLMQNFKKRGFSA